MKPDNIKQIRLEMGLTLRQMGAGLGCSHVFIDSMERGIRPIPKEMVKKLKIFLKKKIKSLNIMLDSL